MFGGEHCRGRTWLTDGQRGDGERLVQRRVVPARTLSAHLRRRAGSQEVSSETVPAALWTAAIRVRALTSCVVDPGETAGLLRLGLVTGCSCVDCQQDVLGHQLLLQEPSKRLVGGWVGRPAQRALPLAPGLVVQQLHHEVHKEISAAADRSADTLQGTDGREDAVEDPTESSG